MEFISIEGWRMGNPKHGHGLFSSARSRRRSVGFTLIETMIVVAIVAILASIAVPSYARYVTKTNRVAAEGCLSELANTMERYYTTNLRYDHDGNNVANAYLMPDCASAQRTGANYDYPAPTGADLQATSYRLRAEPKNAQAARDTQCGILFLDQSGKRDIGGTGTVASCW